MRSHKLGKPFSSKDFALLILGVFFFISAGLIHQSSKRPEIVLSKQDTALNINSNLLVYMSAGNKRMIADIIWVQTLLESDLDHYVGKTGLNWMYLRFSTIAKLDPLFYENYMWGGRYLAIIKDDLEGGIELMDKGLQIYPDDYALNYLLGFTHYYETNNYKEGIVYLEKIMDHPKAPFYLKNIVYKMRVENGFSEEAALELLQTQLKESNDENFKIKLASELYALQAEVDLKCLNRGKKDCRRIDANGRPYIFRGLKYHTIQSFIPFRLRKKGAKSHVQQITTLE